LEDFRAKRVRKTRNAGFVPPASPAAAMRETPRGVSHFGESEASMWILPTPKGTFWIRFVPCGPGFFLLGIDGRELGPYRLPEAAADDVAFRKTGYEEWDTTDAPPVREGLSDWNRIDCADWDSMPEEQSRMLAERAVARPPRDD